MHKSCLHVASCGFLFTAQPEAPARGKAGASGWAVNDEINSLLAPVLFEAWKEPDANAFQLMI